jgi:hypothetical protein
MSDKTREGQAVEKPFAAATGAAPVEERRPAPKNSDRRAHQKAITQGLRKFFDSVAAEPIPAEFLDLLKRMDEEKGGA